MSGWDPLVLIVLGVAACFLFDRLARSRAEGGDSGPFWARMCGRFCLWAGLPLLALAVAQAGGWMRAVSFTSEAWITVVAIFWLALAVLGIMQRGGPASKWLAGAAGFSPRRFWIFGFVAVLAPALYSGAGGWTEPWKAAHWTFAALLGMTLAATALSLQQSKTAALVDASGLPASSDAGTSALRPWPEAMQKAGIQLEALRTLGAEPLPVVSGPARDWDLRLAASGSRGAAPELLAAVWEAACAGSAAPGNAEKHAWLILAPDRCGQEEAIALAATEVAQKTGQATLVIAPAETGGLARELRRWAGPSGAGDPGVRIEVVESQAQLFASADVWVASAEVLSEFLLAHLKEDAEKVGSERIPLLNRIGLVVWCDVHGYSGVKAANVWAISRRLVRLLAAHGRTGLRTIVMSRSFPHRVAQATSFIEHLLPYAYARDREIRIESRQARDMQLYVGRSSLPMTVAASVRSGWPTAVGGDRSDSGPVEPAIWDLDAGVRHRLAASAAQADAQVLAIGDDDVLALPEILCQSGRAGAVKTRHYAALLLPGNPYAEFVMNEYRDRGQTPSSRCLVGAEGHAGLIRRHAEQALRESADTMTGLRNVFRWEEGVLASTLRDLSARGQLSRQAVRFLDSKMRLQRDHLYSSLQPDSGAGRPLETFGTELIELRDMNADEHKGLLLRVDPERATIDAYPQRVFFHAGRRYRVHEWRSSTPEARLACSPEDRDVRTWRCRNARLQRLAVDSAEMAGRGRRRYSVSAEYWEELTSVLEVAPGTTNVFTHLGRPVKTTFSTRALVIETADETPETLHLAAMVFRHLLPVHAGVGETYLDALPLSGVKVGNRTVSGLAIVDLLPGGGAGLVDAIEQDDALLQLLIDRACIWLRDAVRRNQTADTLFAGSPLAQATGGATGLSIGGTLSFLERMSSGGERRN